MVTIRRISSDPIGRAASNEVVASASIPAPGGVPVRPLDAFFSGEAPTWSDIFSGKLYRTSHFARVVNAIHSGKHVVVLGMLGSGKSTLLMQVASEMKYQGLKLVPGPMTQEKSDLLVRSVESKRTLVFMDDLGDNLAATRTLMKQPNIQVVSFERDYFYDQISHLLDNKRVAHLDCTSLTPADIQGLFSAIPQELRYASLRSPTTEPKVQPSVFEILESNMLKPPLRERLTRSFMTFSKRTSSCTIS